MSNDQKPARMRVVSGGAAAAAPQRRLSDAAGAGGVAAPVPAKAAGAPAAASSARTGKLVAVLAILFVAGCAIGGAALPLLGLN